MELENPTFAVIMIPTCSSRLNFPGLRLAETPRVTEGGKLPGWEDHLQEFSGRKCKQLSDIG